jgi:acyl-ACP thioesterase
MNDEMKYHILHLSDHINNNSEYLHRMALLISSHSPHLEGPLYELMKEWYRVSQEIKTELKANLNKEGNNE